MPLTDYTTYSDVRAVLGVQSDELDDATLALQVYEYGLVDDLESVDLTLSTLYTTTKAKPTPTAAESRFLRATTLFATYAVASQLLSSLPLFTFKEVTDGKAGDTRFALDPYKSTKEDVTLQYGIRKAKLLTAFAAVASATAVVSRPFMVVASPSSDPITGT